MAYIGSIHEYGAEHIPQRSFIRSTLDDNSSQIANLSGQLGAKIIEGKQTPEQALNLIGLKVAGMIQEKLQMEILHLFHLLLYELKVIISH